MKIIEINPDFRKAVEDNDGYCPCLIEKTPDTKCMCKDFRESPAGTVCHCGRFKKVRTYEEERQMPTAIEAACVNAICTYDELMMKYSAVCKERDELRAELKRLEH